MPKPLISSRISVQGLPELFRKLDGIEDDYAGPMAETALLAGALPIQNAWKAGVPYETGQYRQSITSYPSGEGGPSERAVEIGTDIVDPPYPFFLEFGTVNMAARPSMRTAFDEHQQEAIREVSIVLEMMLGKYLI